jgi:hypothetical protein
MPRANKHLDDKWVKHCQSMHRRKLKEMRPAIDNKPPPRYIHLEQNLKKQQMDEERYSQIERENYLLLDKMSYIMTHPQLLDEKFMGAPVTFGKSLNKDFRKRELMRITEENLQILRRIQHKEPYYSKLEWDEKARRDAEYLRIAAEYPLVLPSRQNVPRDMLNSSRRLDSHRSRGGGDGHEDLHMGHQRQSAPVQVRIKQGQAGIDSVAGMDFPDRSQLQSRGSSREQMRAAPAMPIVNEEGTGAAAQQEVYGDDLER